eukprot:5867927-Heterocapsa_arctica.AAC.1
MRRHPLLRSYVDCGDAAERDVHLGLSHGLCRFNILREQFGSNAQQESCYMLHSCLAFGWPGDRVPHGLARPLGHDAPGRRLH